jgi:hypothetical protein
MESANLKMLRSVNSRLQTIVSNRDNARLEPSPGGSDNTRRGSIRQRLIRTFVVAMAHNAESSQWYWYSLCVTENQTRAPH